MYDLSRRPGAFRGLGLCWLTLALAAFPAIASDGEVEYRQHVMESLGGHIGAAVDILKQKVPYQEHLDLHVHALADMAGIVHTLFPEGSEGGDALPAIWKNPDDFAARIDTLETAAAGLAAAVDNGDAIGPAFQKLGQACKGCHDNYREE